MEKNLFTFALNYNWPPGSWDNLTIEQFGRLIGRAREMAEEQRAAAPPLPSDM